MTPPFGSSIAAMTKKRVSLPRHLRYQRHRRPNTILLAFLLGRQTMCPP